MKNTHRTKRNSSIAQNTNDPAPDRNSVVQVLDMDPANSAQTTEIVSRRRTPGLWIWAAGLVIGFGISQLSTIGTEAVPEQAIAESAITEPEGVEPDAASTESAWSGINGSSQQELNRAEALSDLSPEPDFTSHDVAEARRMHTLREVFGADTHDCDEED